MNHKIISKRIRSSMMLLIAGAAVLTIFAQPIRAQCQYEIVAVIEGPQICGIHGDFLADVYPQAMNDKMEVVGHYNCLPGDDLPFLWTPDGGFQPLPLPPGYEFGSPHDISNSGAICGTVEWPRRGFIYENGVYTIFEPPVGGNFTEALALNDANQVTGYWGNNVTGPGTVAYIWQDGVLTSLADDLGLPESIGNDISESGKITGWAGTNLQQDSRAFIWSDGKVTLLPPIPGGYTSEGRAIDESMNVSGFGKILDDGITLRQPFLWADGTMNIIPLLPTFERCFPRDMNGEETVLGICERSDVEPNTAFICRNGMMGALNDFVVDLGQIHLVSAEAVNFAGEILARGRITGIDIGVVLRPIDPPLTDLDGDCVTDFDDFTFLLASCGQKGSPADFDGDGIVDFDDFVILLANWTTEP